jgi:hypothetical protein
MYHTVRLCGSRSRSVCMSSPRALRGARAVATRPLPSPARHRHMLRMQADVVVAHAGRQVPSSSGQAMLKCQQRSGRRGGAGVWQHL